MAENIKVNQLEVAGKLQDENRVLLLADEENNEVKTIAKKNLVSSLISTVENNLLTNNGGLFVDGNTINELVDVLKNIQAQDAETIGRPIFTLSNTLLENEIWLEGATVSREEYAQLFEIYGETYGAGDGETTFKLPDFRNRTIWGAANFGYIEAALPQHTHTYGIPRQRVASGGGSAYVVNGSSTQYTTSDAIDDNGIYKSDCDTVQPPAIKVRVKTRFK